MTVLVTGAAGFIGFHTAKRLLARGDTVVGFDNLNDYYDPKLKADRLAQLRTEKHFAFVRGDLQDRRSVETVFADNKPSSVIHLAAQVGVRYGLKNPHAYIDSNVTGFLNILEGCRAHGIEHLVYASSSSVYGANTDMPFSVHQNVDHPLSLYAATKKANELMAHSYAHLYGLPATGLRFFTVYGPWGRPDMAPFSFARKILANEPIDVFNNGRHSRDFTYIDDVVEGIVHCCDHAARPNPQWNSAAPDPATSAAPYRIYNIGNHSPVQLLDYIRLIEKATGKTATMNFLPMQQGDMLDTYADIDSLTADIGFEPKTPIEVGVERFIEWYRNYYKI